MSMRDMVNCLDRMGKEHRAMKCPQCRSQYHQALGVLGHKRYYRCRDCGWTFYRRESAQVDSVGSVTARSARMLVDEFKNPGERPIL